MLVDTDPSTASVSSQQTPTSVSVDHRPPFPTPHQLKREIPISNSHKHFVDVARDISWNIMTGVDPRLLVVIGPCSIHDPAAAIDYAERLAQLTPEISDVMYPVMRTYFEKPRTVTGWKGLLHDPFLDNSGRIAEGISIARKLLRTIVDLGVPTATEALSQVMQLYIEDYIAWTSIGARTSETQGHRDMASGLSSPVGFKNSTLGGIDAAINGIRASAAPQIFLGAVENGSNDIVRTQGNKRCHIVLRGGSKPNYEWESIQTTCKELNKAGITAGVMVDCNHANSGKDPMKQSGILKTLIDARVSGNAKVFGVMIESNIVGGKQEHEGNESLVYGQSITDSCLGWNDTRDMLLRSAESIRILERQRSGGE